MKEEAVRGVRQMGALIEAYLFAKGSPAALKDICQALDEEAEDVKGALSFLSEKYGEESSGITLHHTGAGYSLTTKKEYHQWLTAVLGKEAPLSQAALETLAVVADQEPVTRAAIEKVRGVSAGRILSQLIEKGLIEERGRLDAPGRPILYGTTRRFLAAAGVGSVEELKQFMEK